MREFDHCHPLHYLGVLRYADYGGEAYGSAVIVNPAFAAKRPEAVKAFVRAVVAGTHLAIKHQLSKTSPAPCISRAFPD